MSKNIHRSPFVTGLACRECGALYPVEIRSACSECFGPVEVAYDYPAIAREVSRDEIASRPRTLWRYREFLPAEPDGRDLSAGFTPLRRAGNLGARLGLKNLYIKDDTVNPTNSFKDRPVAVAVAKAREWGLAAVGCASTGNLAGATAAAAARAGLPCYVFVPAHLERPKLLAPLLYGATVIGIEGTYDDANRIANLVAEKHRWGLVNINIRPYYTEGSKTLALEVAEQLGWRLPDRIVVPLGSGALLCAVHRAFRELVETRLVAAGGPMVCGSQPEGCSPIADAFAAGSEEIVPVREPKSVAESLAIGDPASGHRALRALRSTGGFADAPSTEDVLGAQRLLAATEGLLAEPAGATVVASIKRKVEQGTIGRDEVVVACITGSGLKTPDVLAMQGLRLLHAGNRIEDVERLIASGG